MRKLFVAITLALALAGCGSGSLSNFGATAVQFATVGVANPITKKELAIVNRSFLALLRPTVAYIELRTCRLSEDELRSWASLSPCADYDRKVAVQDAMIKGESYRQQLKEFVRTNRTLDAQIAYSELQKAIAIMRTVPKKGA